MNIIIHPGKLSGSLSVIPSKSLAHRMLICGAFADSVTELYCPEVSRDMDATATCLNALGADIRRTAYGYSINPVRTVPQSAVLPCRDSGSTLRFLLPVVGALGITGIFQLDGRLSQRPLSPLWEEMEKKGCSLSYIDRSQLQCTGRLQAGVYQIDGSVSSQFITGLLLATALIPGKSRIEVTGKLESKPYVELTQYTMALFGCPSDRFAVTGGIPFQSPGHLEVEGDWSNGAFFLAANALGSNITVRNLSRESLQGDSAAVTILPQLKNRSQISAADIPDLIPILAVVAACNKGAVFTDIQRLRLKESDRVASTVEMIKSLGGQAEATETTLTVYGNGLIGGTVDCVNDHRIAMATAIAATNCKEDVILLGAECIEKSYPKFFEEYRHLGGNYEQYLR